MRFARWLDHAPPWASWGALAASGFFSAWEMLFMALPLTAAVAAEAMRLQLLRWRRFLEIACLLFVIVCGLTKLGWVLIVILLMFMLCGVRLSLPREQKHRRQIIFMSFLLFLLTTVANASISFLPWALIWIAFTSLTLLQLNWECSAHLRGTTTPPPLRQVLIWIPIAALISGAVFLVIPRLPLGRRPMPFGINGFIGATAGLSDSLSLENAGAIQGSGQVVARILPPPDVSVSERKSMESRMSLLTGFRMEHATKGRWEALGRTPERYDIDISSTFMKDENTIEYYVYPTPTGLIPMPQGKVQIFQPRNMRIVLRQSGEMRWAYPLAHPMPFSLRLRALEAEAISEYQIQIRGLRTPDPAAIEALHWSRRVAPEHLHPADLADILARDLQTFRYTLDNPSGSAKDPLGDFLTHTRAGHCEYYAHALASALRYRGIASRVVNGYRLGTWIKEGGYWLVTQNEAHSWVEYVNPDTNTWVSIDPTPSASFHKRWHISEKIEHLMDTMRFRWDRYVVRFSDAEQQRGFAWMQNQFIKLKVQKFSNKTVYIILAGFTALFLLLATWQKRNRIRQFFRTDIPPGTVIALRPLIKSTNIQPLPGETLRDWIKRLCTQRPDRRTSLLQLADLIEQNVYGRMDADIMQPIKSEAKKWKQKNSYKSMKS